MEFDTPADAPDGQAFSSDPPNDRRDVAERTDIALEDDRLSRGRTDGRPPHLSPSSSSMYRQCARKWKYRYVDKLPDPPGVPALAGTFAHRVLEVLLQLPQGQRSQDEAKKIARQVWPETANDDDFRALQLSADAAKEFRWRGWTAVQGLWAIEDPNAVAVHATEHDVRIEIEGVPFRGIVDRIDVEDDGLIISDYKSGRAPSARFSEERLTQVLLYAAAVRAMTGQKPARARLLYLGQRTIEVEASDENLSAATDMLSQTWDSLCGDCDRGEFDATVGPLCAWCPFVGSCAEGQVEVRRRSESGMVRADAPGLAVLAATA